MAVDPHTAKIIAQAVISQITDEEKRQRLVIGIIILIVNSIIWNNFYCIIIIGKFIYITWF